MKTPARIFSTARYQGNRVKTIPRTITLKVGELTSVASAVSTRPPALIIPWAMGAAQLTHTPSGVPMSMPCSAPASFPPGRRRSSGRMVIIAAASSRP